MGSSHLRKRVFIGIALVLVVAVGAGVYVALSAWSQVNRVSIERPTESGAPQQQDNSSDDAVSSDGEPVFDTSPSTEGTDVFLLVGSDSREDLADTEGFGDFEGNRADVVMVVIRSEGEAAVLSLPRDLWVGSACDGEKTRLNEELEGCGDILNGPTLLTITVESILGETIDHFALVDLAGFQEAVDAIGGYEICLENPVRDVRAQLSLPAGCTVANGEQTLAWLRSRHTQELTQGDWRTIPGVNDLSRNKRQRDFLIDMMGRLSDFGSPQSIAGTAKAVAPYVTVDSDLSLVTAVNLAWTLRGMGEGHVVELEVPVEDYTTPNGAAVLRAVTPVDTIVAEFLATTTADSGSALVESQGAALQAENDS